MECTVRRDEEERTTEREDGKARERARRGEGGRRKEKEKLVDTLKFDPM